MTGTRRGRTATILGHTLAGVGIVTVLLWAGLLAIGYANDYSTEHTMTAAHGYLNGAPRDPAAQCTVEPANGEPRRITVPAMPRRGIHLSGTRLDRSWAGTATITCEQPTHFTQGALAWLVPIAAQWAVLLLGLAITATGLQRLGLFRRASRYP